MASTYVLISSNTLSSSAASVTFSSIPSTYTDLVLRWSARSDQSGQMNTITTVKINSLTTTVYSDTDLTGNGSTATSGRDTNNTIAYGGYINGPSSTANTFCNSELYIPNYATSSNHQFSVIGMQENNSSTQYDANIRALAELVRDANPITTITLANLASANFVSGSSFYLYGIKNS